MAPQEGMGRTELDPQVMREGMDEKGGCLRRLQRFLLGGPLGFLVRMDHF
jgi:hypothetical protein